MTTSMQLLLCIRSKIVNWCNTLQSHPTVTPHSASRPPLACSDTCTVYEQSSAIKKPDDATIVSRSNNGPIHNTVIITIGHRENYIGVTYICS